MNITNFAADELVSPAPTYTTTGADSGTPMVLIVLYIAVVVVVLAGMWKTFSKASRPGWAAIIPIYNIYTLVKVAGRPGWWTILYFIPFVNFVISIIISLDVAKAFGKGAGFGIFGLWLFGFIGYPMLGFGSATYQGSGSSTPAAPAAPTPVASVQ